MYFSFLSEKLKEESLFSSPFIVSNNLLVHGFMILFKFSGSLLASWLIQNSSALI